MKEDLNVLTWHDSKLDQERFKWYAYGRVHCVYTPVNLLPPFQIPIAKTGSSIDKVEIFDINDNLLADITTEMVDSGLDVLTFTDRDYDLIFFPSTVPMGTTFSRGTYWAKITIGGMEKYSETFGFLDDLSGFIKLEWCHHGPFNYKGGHIAYTTSGYGNGYKNRIYLQTTLAKPNYPNDKQEEQRGGHKFNLFQVSSKEHIMVFKTTETVLDALRVVDLHDVVTLEAGGKSYDVDEFLFNQEWTTDGDIAIVTASVFTNRVIVETPAGGGPSSETCEVAEGTCIPPTGSYYAAQSVLSIGDPNWIMGTYNDKNGALKNLKIGQYVIGINGDVEDLNAAANLYSYNSPNNFTQVNLLGVYTKIYVYSTGEYWFNNGVGSGTVNKSNIGGYTTLTDPYTYYGALMEGFYGLLYVVDDGGAEIFAKKVTTDLELNLGVQIESAGAAGILLKTGTVKCGIVQEYFFPIDDSIVFSDVDNGGIVFTTVDGGSIYFGPVDEEFDDSGL